jgi:hypothetical protein
MAMPRPGHVALLLVCWLCLLSEPASAAAKKKKSADKPDGASTMVEQVLRSEVAGAVDRRGQLAGILKERPAAPEARWQAGFVRDGSLWRSFDEPPTSTVEAGPMREYRDQREQAPQTWEGQLGLADWCRKKGLNDHERAHLFAALAKAPEQEQPALLARLGYARVGTQWVSGEQIRDWEAAARRAEASLAKWSPRLERIAQRLAGTRPQRDAARTELRAIHDPSAVPAIDGVLVGRDGDAALEAVEALRRIEGADAALVLAKLGVFSPQPEVRTSAATALKGRRQEDFVPSLISLLATPAQGEWRSFHDAFRNLMFYTYVVTVEKENHIEVLQSQLVQQGVVVQQAAGGGGMPASGWSLNTDALRELRDRLASRERWSAATNERIAELNQRVIAVLSSVSGNAPSDDARVWWQWWSEQSDVQSPETKPVTVSRVTESLGNPYQETRAECFAAGTPVWTEQGLSAIERVKIGDRVLSKDVETGELTYQPVLQTTVRPPKELTTLRFADETIVCTGGHRFWSSGSGWVKARDLEPQTLLHTATGNTLVWSAKKGNTAETYNLVVADFHTYFVGKTGVLSQDVLIPKSTNRLVPGLSSAQATAQK